MGPMACVSAVKWWTSRSGALLWREPVHDGVIVLICWIGHDESGPRFLFHLHYELL